MTTCCGSERSSAYCPECGRCLNAAAVGLLVRHLEKKAQGYEERLEALRAAMLAEGEDNTSAWSKKREKELAADATKWRAWAEWVRAKAEE